MQLTFWEKLRYLLLLLLVALITISSHPTIVETSRNAGLESGTILSRYIILVFLSLFLICLNVNSMMKVKVVRKVLGSLVFIALAYLLTFSLFGERSMVSDIRAILICLMAIMIGCQLNIDDRKYRFLLFAFSLLMLFVGLMQVFVNIGGFVILDQYHADNKNRLGVMLVTAGVILFYMGLNYSKNKLVKAILYVLAILIFIVLLTVRARTATLTAFIMALYILYERYKGKDFFAYFIIGLIVIALFYLFSPQSVKDYVYNSFFQNYEERDVTSGRTERNRAALTFLSKHIFIGNLNQNVSIGWVHNYLLNKLFEYGLVFSLPFVSLYLYLLIYVIKKTLRSKKNDIRSIGYYLLLVPFIISMAEPTLPFGPGNATVFNFLVFGMAIGPSERANTPSVVGS